ncbi:PadR family transcriptional regulator [Luteitalea sp.]
MSISDNEVPYGTLDLLILRTLQTMGALHGYGLARRIEQVSASTLRLSQGSIYPALVRLEKQGAIGTDWGTSETGRKVKVFSLTDSGRGQLERELRNWESAKALVARFLEAES